MSTDLSLRPVRLSTGRKITMDDCTGSAPIFDVLEAEGLTFASPEALARWVGHFYGWRSTTPTHGFGGWDGVAWWVLSAMTLVYSRWPMSYFDLVPGLEAMTSGYHGNLVLLALEAAGLVVAPIETVAAR